MRICTNGKGSVTVTIVGITNNAPPGQGPGSGPGCVVDCPPTYETIGSCDNVPEALWATCTGTNTGNQCLPGQASYEFYQVTATTRTLIVTYCRDPKLPPPPPPPPPTTLVEEYIKAFPPIPAVGDRQPAAGRPLPVTLDLYVMATQPAQTDGQVGRNGLRVTVHFTKARYIWDYGDGTAPTTTTDPGGRYPTGTVTHPYAHPGDYTVTLRVQWLVTYDFTLGGATATGVTYGWLDQPGVQTFPVHVVEAHGTLVG